MCPKSNVGVPASFPVPFLYRHKLKLNKRFETGSSTFQLQALKPGAVNRISRGKIAEYDTQAVNQGQKAKDVVVRACNHGF